MKYYIERQMNPEAAVELPWIVSVGCTDFTEAAGEAVRHYLDYNYNFRDFEWPAIVVLLQGKVVLGRYRVTRKEVYVAEKIKEGV